MHLETLSSPADNAGLFLFGASMAIPRVLVVVEGGVVQDVLSDMPIRLIIKDWDNIKEGDKLDPVFPPPEIAMSFEALDDAVVAGLKRKQIVKHSTKKEQK